MCIQTPCLAATDAIYATVLREYEPLISLDELNPQSAIERYLTQNDIATIAHQVHFDLTT